MNTENIIENGLYRLKDGAGWCKHGIVKTYKDKDGTWLADDTYWSTNPHTYLVEDIVDRMEFLLDLNNSMEVTREEFSHYNDEDKVYIPVGGWHEKYLVIKDAQKNNNYLIDDLQYRIRESENYISHHKYLIEKYKEELNALK